MKSALYIISIYLLYSCHLISHHEIDHVMAFAKTNRPELEKVLTHYQHDSLKLKAACFLILNMPGHGSYTGKNIEVFYAGLDSLLSFPMNTDSCKATVNQLIEHQNVLIGLKWQEDIHTIKADFLINNIDRAFEAWQQEPFAKQLDFDGFCEYILPYRIENEPLEYWRDSITPHYNSIKNAGYFDGSEYSTYWACAEINDSLRNEYKPRLENDNWPLTKKYSTMKQMPYGKCHDYATQATFVLRAKGIPTAIDFTPQWPSRSLGHTWNVIKANNGNSIIFGGILDEKPGVRSHLDAKLAKVYRMTYAINKESLAYKRENEPIPKELASPFFIDVTSEYFKGVDVRIPIRFEPSEKRKYMYLHVFDNQRWIPVTFAEKKRGVALFKEMGKDIMYLPAYYVNIQPEPASYPFVMDLLGNIHFYQPDTDKVRTLKLNRKYPFNNTQRYSGQRMIGGQIQGSDRADFKTAQTIYTITEDPFGKRIKAKINPEGKKCRYWRYLAPDGACGNIAELEFFYKEALYNNEGTIIGTTGSYNNMPDRTREMAFDGNPLTYFDADAERVNGAWVGMDFKKQVCIDAIAYIPRSDDNNVFPGDEYELLYYGEKGWNSLGCKKAIDFSIIFDSVPNNAVLWLRNLTKGKEERIFTYEEDKIRWW